MGMILPILTALLLFYADFQSGKRIPKNVHGQFALKLNRSYKWVGIVCCFTGSFLMNAAIIHWNKEIAVMAPIAISIFFGLGVAILIGYYKYSVVFDDKRIIVTNWIGKKRTIKWTAIENIKFNATSGYLKLYAKVGKIVVLQHSTGFVEFLKRMESNSRFRAEELRIPFRT
ncbi:hypothetical protein ABV409_11105 [Flagellimonas sp. DF-77]|uniref:hypothetical protein n=1 Tax=Flagellimonas algarum TaxID=3230298 RepID=UPI00339B9552